jgi:hypothetical protein
LDRSREGSCSVTCDTRPEAGHHESLVPFPTVCIENWVRGSALSQHEGLPARDTDVGLNTFVILTTFSKAETCVCLLQHFIVTA